MTAALWLRVRLDPPPITGDQARELARRELTRPIYHRDDPSALDRFLQRLKDWLDSLTRAGGDPMHAGSGGGGGIVALVIILLGLAAIVALVLWYMRRHRNTKSTKAALLDGEPSTAAEHRTAAERFAASGRWAEAIRERLRGIARDLEERAILEPRPGRTADELAGEAARSLPGLGGGLAEGVRIFDDVWYGDRPGTPEGYQTLTALEDQVRKARPRPLAELADSPNPLDSVPALLTTDWSGRRAEHRPGDDGGAE